MTGSDLSLRKERRSGLSYTAIEDASYPPPEPTPRSLDPEGNGGGAVCEATSKVLTFGEGDS